MNKYITCAENLVTTREETRAGFINFALEKNRKSTPFIEEAKALRVLASKAKKPSDLVEMEEIRVALLSAAGLSDKSLKYFNNEDKVKAIQELVGNFLEPAGVDFVNELVFRYLLTKGDSLGGSMRNLVGSLAQQKFVRSLTSMLRVLNVPYMYIDTTKNSSWVSGSSEHISSEDNIKAISWSYLGEPRVLVFNLTIPAVGKNIDICLFRADHQTNTDTKIQDSPETIILLGELKGGIDPAGADEHWKTANSALLRITKAFEQRDQKISTVFIGAAIESAMANEIYSQLLNGQLTNAANLSNETQLMEVCNWIITLK